MPDLEAVICPECFALVELWRMEDHRRWHAEWQRFRDAVAMMESVDPRVRQRGHLSVVVK